jgi:hypothetical protein
MVHRMDWLEVVVHGRNTAKPTARTAWMMVLWVTISTGASAVAAGEASSRTTASTRRAMSAGVSSPSKYVALIRPWWSSASKRSNTCLYLER